jgi:hypothetical protein
MGGWNRPDLLEARMRTRESGRAAQRGRGQRVSCLYNRRSARSPAPTYLPPLRSKRRRIAGLKPYGETFASVLSHPGSHRSMRTPECPPQATARGPPPARQRTVQHSRCRQQFAARHRSHGPNNDRGAVRRLEGGPNNDHGALHRHQRGRHSPHKRPPKARLPLQLSSPSIEFSCSPPNKSQVAPGNLFIFVGSPHRRYFASSWRGVTGLKPNAQGNNNQR